MKHWRRVLAYFDNDDPRLAIAAVVALVVVGNQPFYPLYVAWIAGSAGWAACVTLFSTPVFAAVPGVARRRPVAGKLLLLGAGIANTALCTFALGRGSWIELFYIPCLVLAAILFGRRERLAALGGCALAMMLASAAVRGQPLATMTGAELASLARLHAASVAALVLIIAVAVIRRWDRLRAG